MRSSCEACGHRFEREPGFYLGAIYFNYGLAALVATVAFPVMRFAFEIPARNAMVALLIVCVALPLLFFRHARSLWLGFDEFLDPQATSQTTASRTDGHKP